MSINTILTALCADLKSQLKIKICTPHAGQFNQKELNRLQVKTPAAYITCTAVADCQFSQTDTRPIALDCICFIVTGGRDRDERAGEAISLTEKAIIRLTSSGFIETGLGKSKNVKAQNLYSSALDKTGCTIWAIRFTLNTTISNKETDNVR